MIIECKNEAYSPKISKNNAGQMLNSIGWFNGQYSSKNYFPLFFHPAGLLDLTATPGEPLYVFDKSGLKTFKSKIQKFFVSLCNCPIEEINEDKINYSLPTYSLNPTGFPTLFKKATH
ncbi:MAG: hypothetical protein ACTSYI_16460 [Promethearchaeota archaeon]